jgi:hypothetical protein
MWTDRTLFDDIFLGQLWKALGWFLHMEILQDSFCVNGLLDQTQGMSSKLHFELWEVMEFS